jgi:excisionase family DNA binding protein
MSSHENNSSQLTRQTGLIEPQKVAGILKISIKTVHKLVREGKLPCVQVTVRERRFTPEQVQQYIESQSTGIRVDKKENDRVSSRPRKGGATEKTDVSRASLRKEMRSWL